MELIQQMDKHTNLFKHYLKALLLMWMGIGVWWAFDYFLGASWTNAIFFGWIFTYIHFSEKITTAHLNLSKQIANLIRPTYSNSKDN